jgi:hypothetical protein
MDLIRTMSRFLTLFLLLILPTVFACSTPRWFPLKKSPSFQAKSREFIDKEVVVIDREEYVKVLNPKAAEGGTQPKYAYVPIREYQANRSAYIPVEARHAEANKEPSAPAVSTPAPAVPQEMWVTSSSKGSSADLKKKVMVLYLDDRVAKGEESFGDWISEKLLKEVERRSQRVLFVDFPMIRDFLEKKGIDAAEIEKPETLKMLNELFGLNAVVTGQLSGPYIFSSQGVKDQEGTSSAIVRVEVRLIDTLSGRVLKSFTTNNPIVATREKGSFSEERAKIRAIDLTMADLSRSLARDLDNMEWFGRAARIDSDEVYLNAGRLTGLKEGDVVEIVRPGKPGERDIVRGKIRISSCFGMDASMGKLIQGETPEADDILRPERRRGT